MLYCTALVSVSCICSISGPFRVENNGNGWKQHQISQPAYMRNLAGWPGLAWPGCAGCGTTNCLPALDTQTTIHIACCSLWSKNRTFHGWSIFISDLFDYEGGFKNRIL